MNRLWSIAGLIVLLLSSCAESQALDPFPAFDLINYGYGAPAMGMAGAVVAVAKDPTTIYWNPAGLGQLQGLQASVDYIIHGDSDEDFASETQANRFDSAQRYSLTGSNFGSVAFSYAFTAGKMRIVPGFSWQRTAFVGAERELKETAGLVNFITDTNFVQSEGIFREEYSQGREELSFALGAAVSESVVVGGSWTFLAGKPERTLSGIFQDARTTQDGTTRTDLTLNEKTTDDLGGSYLKAGLIVFPSGPVSFGGYLRFPYTRTAVIQVERAGSFITNGTVGGAIDETATAESEIEIPFEWSAGVALRPKYGITVGASFTYSDWNDTERIINSSSNPLIIPDGTLSYPTLRQNAGAQYSLLQLRAGIEYLAGQPSNGYSLRAGILRDGQPYANTSGERVYFNGYTFGAGFAYQGLTLDVAFVREKGDLTFTPFSDAPSELSSRRFVITVGWIGI